MKKYCRITFFIACLTGFTVLLSGCGSKTVVDQSSQDEKFEVFKKYFVEQCFQISPSIALFAGKHDFDSILQILTKGLIEKQTADYLALLDSMGSYDETKLSDANRIDYKMIRDQINSEVWYRRDFRSYEWDPSFLNVAGGFAEILNGRYASLEMRLKNFNKRMQNVSAFYEEGKKLITTPTIEHTDLAILQNEGSCEEVFGKALRDSINSSTLSEEEKNNMLVLAETAKNAMLNYVGWLKEKRKGMTVANSKSFRIGKDYFDKKFDYDIVSQFTAEEMYEKAVKRKAEIHHQMANLSRQLWPKYFKDVKMPVDSLVLIKQMIERLSLNHVKPEDFLSAIEKQIPDLVNFINDKKLIYIDPAKPLKVRKTPGYMEGGGAGASISAPGPFDKDANTYYNVSPLTGYTPEAAESYLREYNHYVLQILNIHEAIPGHYTQLVYSNNSPSLIKSLFGNGAMIEGWAVYAERMMLENGYGNDEPEIWLLYYKWHLRSVCNTILDYSVHVLNMSEEDAKRLLIEGDFQQEAEAEGKWRRVKLTQVQLCSYFTGFTEIYSLRTELQEKQGKTIDLKKFHEQFLSYGSAPVKYIRELMINQAANK